MENPGNYDDVLKVVVPTIFDIITLISLGFVCRNWYFFATTQLGVIKRLLRSVFRDTAHRLPLSPIERTLALQNGIVFQGHSSLIRLRSLIPELIGDYRVDQKFKCETLGCYHPCRRRFALCDLMGTPGIGVWDTTTKPVIEKTERDAIIPWIALAAPNCPVVINILNQAPLRSYMITRAKVYRDAEIGNKFTALSVMIGRDREHEYSEYRRVMMGLSETSSSLNGKKLDITVAKEFVERILPYFHSKILKIIPYKISEETVALCHVDGCISVFLASEVTSAMVVTSCMRLVSELVGHPITVPDVLFVENQSGWLRLPPLARPLKKSERLLDTIDAKIGQPIRLIASSLVVNYLFGISSPYLLVHPGGPFFIGYANLYALDRIRLVEVVEELGGRRTREYEFFVAQAIQTFTEWRRSYRYIWYYLSLIGISSETLESRFYPDLPDNEAISRFNQVLDRSAEWSVGKSAWFGY